MTPGQIGESLLLGNPHRIDWLRRKLVFPSGTRFNSLNQADQSFPVMHLGALQAKAPMPPPAQRQGRKRNEDEQCPQLELQPAAIWDGAWNGHNERGGDFLLPLSSSRFCEKRQKSESKSEKLPRDGKTGAVGYIKDAARIERPEQ
jgi:hypothetical protein